MKIEKLNINGKKDSIEVLDKIFSVKINKKLVNNVLYKTNANYKGRHAKTKQQNKSEKKLSIASLISDKKKNNNLVIFSDFQSEIKKTKEMNSILKKFEILNSLIILDKTSKDKVEKSIRNIPNIKVTDINHFSAFDIVKFKKVVFTESSVKELEKRYS